jgi:hypothetical protein
VQHSQSPGEAIGRAGDVNQSYMSGTHMVVNIAHFAKLYGAVERAAFAGGRMERTWGVFRKALRLSATTFTALHATARWIPRDGQYLSKHACLK